jgi:hypothetical protein
VNAVPIGMPGSVREANAGEICATAMAQDRAMEMPERNFDRRRLRMGKDSERALRTSNKHQVSDFDSAQE